MDYSRYATNVFYNFTKNTFNSSLNNFFFFNEFFFEKHEDMYLDGVVDFKKNTSLFKKKSNINSFFLTNIQVSRFYKLHFFQKNDLLFHTYEDNEDKNEKKNYLCLNNTLNINFKKINFSFKKKFQKKKKLNKKNKKEFFFDNTIFDLTDKFMDVLLLNRLKIMSIFRIKYHKKKKASKLLKPRIKLSAKDFFLNFEFSLINILLRSHFFLNKNDVIFFVKKGFVFINGVKCCNFLKVIKITDKINLLFGKFFFIYYRNVIDKIDDSLKKVNRYFWIQNKKHYDLHKQQKHTAPGWAEHFLYYTEDIPNFLDVDYLTLTIFILYNPMPYEYNHILLKYLNIYKRRLYNWKFV